MKIILFTLFLTLSIICCIEIPKTTTLEEEVYNEISKIPFFNQNSSNFTHHPNLPSTKNMSNFTKRFHHWKNQIREWKNKEGHRWGRHHRGPRMHEGRGFNGPKETNGFEGRHGHRGGRHHEGRRQGRHHEKFGPQEERGFPKPFGNEGQQEHEGPNGKHEGHKGPEEHQGSNNHPWWGNSFKEEGRREHRFGSEDKKDGRSMRHGKHGYYRMRRHHVGHFLFCLIAFIAFVGFGICCCCKCCKNPRANNCRNCRCQNRQPLPQPAAYPYNYQQFPVMQPQPQPMYQPQPQPMYQPMPQNRNINNFSGYQHGVPVNNVPQRNYAPVNPNNEEPHIFAVSNNPPQHYPNINNKYPTLIEMSERK